MILYQVDAFTDKQFSGNPAGVCILDKELDESTMQNIAMEMNLSETAFVQKAHDHFSIRYFTPEKEIPLCGHATLSSAHILYELGIVGKNEKIIFQASEDMLTIENSDNWLTMDFPLYSLSSMDIPEDFEDITNIINTSELIKSDRCWIIASLVDEDAIKNCQPYFEAMKQSPYDRVVVTAKSINPEYDYVMRCFVPGMGITEDPVTGSVECALAPYWASKLGKSDFQVKQLSKRGGIKKVSLVDNRVKISGQAVTMFKLEIL